MPITLAIIRPSSREKNSDLDARIEELRQVGFEVRFIESLASPDWPYTASSAEKRVRDLEQAVFDPSIQGVLAARGGYGASDLLPLLNWTKLHKSTAKPIIGFSDVSALHAAFYGRLGWAGLHAPMPATSLWRIEGPEVRELLAILNGLKRGQATLPIAKTWCHGAVPAVEGRLFGGCMSVLTNLIGTPFFPALEQPHILFFEDTDESPARLSRYINQWILSGALKQCVGILLGVFRNANAEGHDCTDEIGRQFSMRTGLPIFFSNRFGHIRNNLPIGVGCRGYLDSEKLTWEIADVITTTTYV